MIDLLAQYFNFGGLLAGFQHTLALWTKWFELKTIDALGIALGLVEEPKDYLKK